MIDIRRAGDADWEASRDIRLRALADTPDAFSSTLARESAFDESVWIGRIEGSFQLIAWADNDPVGTVTGITDRHEAGSREIVAMWVDPDHRGQGIGELLVSTVVRWAADDAASAIALWVADGNEAARRLYERCGFVATGQRDLIRDGLEEERMRRGL